jgi:GBSi1, group II intron, maturase
MNHGVFEMNEVGTPQGGPLSPLLSNIMLNELDKELEHRGHPFVRYADDAMIFCKSKRAAMRVKATITRFIESKLHLKVNKEKTVASYVRAVKYLDYSLLYAERKMQTHGSSQIKNEDEGEIKTLD